MPIDAPSSNNLYKLLGLPSSSNEINTIIPSDAKPIISKLSNYIYHAYKPLGISLCFTSDKENLVLDAIDIYNGKTRDGFSQFALPEELPCGLKSTMQAYEIVSLLGEPDRKGGGGQTRLPCWIEYKFNSSEGRDSGLLIQLHGLEWEDREMGWTSIVLY
ncbi:uncharacterized protein BX663DRAFT_501397 [Cokeromyces recurvatus]|uniref:uncharacterized protein n=1 Tax=Cokeromyces recurvatus TaxID=90255 RepID=UPI00221F51FF|nr:uncharacterized protein BX663DRAFT_501397 [Cokeromyces recurvatus]KAI7905023.1 hypothetical protein BX663DRAFT_501397 [Cokeromyces recurvatus]